MIRLALAAATLLAVTSCNPATRCTSPGDCPAGASCSGGFCSEPAPPAPGDRDYDDVDGPDAGTRDAGPGPDAGQLDDGR